MFSYQTHIHLRDTDATGVLYFAEQFRLALEAFEHFLKQVGFPLQALIDESSFLLPVVHAESDYFAPLQVGDEISIQLFLAHVGISSFSINYMLVKQDREVGEVTIVHAAVSKESKAAIPLSEKLINILKKLPSQSE
jgi:1,4-dihydroxy-2-naphthoyl-CoA hydrolase